MNAPEASAGLLVFLTEMPTRGGGGEPSPTTSPAPQGLLRSRGPCHPSTGVPRLPQGRKRRFRQECFVFARCLPCGKTGQSGWGAVGPKAQLELWAIPQRSCLCHLPHVMCCPRTRAADGRLMPCVSLGVEGTLQNLPEGTVLNREECDFQSRPTRILNGALSLNTW